MRSYHVSMIAGWIAAGLDVWASGDQAIVSVLFFAWIGVYAAATSGCERCSGSSRSPSPR